MKFKVEITATGFSMLEDDFNITLKRGGTSKTYQKADLIFGEDGFFLCFDTRDFGSGVLTAIITAYVPDDDFDDGLRTEVYKFDIMTIDK